MRDGIHDGSQPTLHHLLLVLEFVDQVGHVVDRAFSVHAFFGGIQDGLRFFFAQQNVPGRRRGSNL